MGPPALRFLAWEILKDRVCGRRGVTRDPNTSEPAGMG